MKIEQISLEQFQPYAQNTKAHLTCQRTKIARTITEFQWDQPIMVDMDMVIIKAHGRYLLAKERACTPIPVVVADYPSPAHVQRDRLSD